MAGFREIIGHEQIVENMKNSIRYNKISHAYILSGEDGMGKMMLAKAFAMTLLCEKQGVEPCMQCHSCKQFLSGNHPDVVFVTHDKPNSIGVDDIRYKLNDDIQIKPYSSPYKIYIVDEAELMTEQAQNALLKTIEEPPAYAVILLLTENEKLFLPTILSRCVKFSLKPLPDSRVKEYLKTQFGVEGEKADMYAAFSRGNLGKAIHLATSENFQVLYGEVLKLLKNIKNMDICELLDYIKNLTEENLNVDDILDFVQMWYRDVLIFKVTRNMNLLVFKEEYQKIQEFASKTSYEGIEQILKAVDKARARLKANVNLELAMELLLLVMKEN
ncbi:MAG: DNA polymerase III subunit delta' [bacterium]|nr:DNA polymerase III subunit delta' [bacterium]